MPSMNEKDLISMSGEQLESFGREFLRKYMAHGYGTMPKREMDILVFHLISNSIDLKDMSNYEIANKLKLPESRVKSMRLEASLKHKPANHKAIVGSIVLRLIDEFQKPEFDGSEITIGLEDPVEKREFEYAVKLTGNHVEYGINRELLKVKPLQLLEIIIANVENGEDEFVALIKSNITEKKKQKKIIRKSLTLRQKFAILGNEVSDKAGLASLLVKASGLLAS